jgi:hypothetical protein
MWFSRAWPRLCDRAVLGPGEIAARAQNARTSFTGGAYVPTVVVGMYAPFGVVGVYHATICMPWAFIVAPVARRGPDNGRIHRDNRRRDVCATRATFRGSHINLQGCQGGGSILFNGFDWRARSHRAARSAW